MADLVAAVRLVQDQEIHDFLKARLTMAAVVQHVLSREGFDTLVVGGTAVDTYVGGAFGTSESQPADWVESLDIDTIVLQGTSGASIRAAVSHLESQGFIAGPTRSGVRYPGIRIPVDFVGFGFPDDYSPDHAFEVHMEEWEEFQMGAVRMAGPEDILFDYTESGWDTRHQRDWARALAIAHGMEDQLDLGYLFTKAEWRMGGAFVGALEQVLRGAPLEA